MPEIDLEPTRYRMVEPPRASRFNAAIVLIGTVVCFAIVYFGATPTPRETVLMVAAALVGIGTGWAVVRLISPKPYVLEDDPERLKNPAARTWIGRAFARPAGFDAPGRWIPRILMAIAMGLALWWTRSQFGHH